MRNLLVPLLFIFLLILAFTICRVTTAPAGTMQIPTVVIDTPIATAPSVTITAPTIPAAAPTLAAAPPVTTVELPAENSEWYIDGWAEDGIVVNMYGREMRFDLAEFRNSQTNAAIVVQCIDPQANRPNRDFAVPVEQRDRFIYKGNQFWHSTNPSVQRFIFVRHGELP